MKENPVSQHIENETQQSSTDIEKGENMAKSATESYNYFDITMKRTSTTQHSESCTTKAYWWKDAEKENKNEKSY